MFLKVINLAFLFCALTLAATIQAAQAEVSKKMKAEIRKMLDSIDVKKTDQKSLKAKPIVMQEILPISQKWAVSLLPKFEKRLKEELNK